MQEFVDFLETSLEDTVGKVDDLADTDWRSMFDDAPKPPRAKEPAEEAARKGRAAGEAAKKEAVDSVEDMLAKLKREMGL